MNTADKEMEVIAEMSWLSPLDAFRGLLALWVMYGHLAGLLSQNIPIVSTAGPAVDLFMVISGILMGFNYVSREAKEPWGSWRTWFKFYIRRFFRIAPLYYLIFAVNILSRKNLLILRTEIESGGYTSIARKYIEGSSTALDVILHATFTYGLSQKYASMPFLPDWSIGLEMQFYLVFPFLMLLTRKMPAILLAMSACIVSIVSLKILWGVYDGSQPGLLGLYPQPTLLPMKISLFVCGIIIALAIRSISKNEPRVGGILLTAATLLAAISQPRIVTVGVGAIIFALIGVANRSDCLSRLIIDGFGLRCFSILAELSYSIYLVHNLIIIVVVWALLKIPSYVCQLGEIRWAIACIVSTAVVLPLAWLLYVYIEKPGILIGRVFALRVNNFSSQDR
jgi:peptidoglycan/LPS O-acetylase OafA/YrhL